MRIFYKNVVLIQLSLIRFRENDRLKAYIDVGRLKIVVLDIGGRIFHDFDRRFAKCLLALAFDIILGVTPEPRDLELLIPDHVVLLAEQLPDRFLLLLEPSLEHQQGTKYTRQLLISKTPLGLVARRAIVQLSHQITAFLCGRPQGLSGTNQLLLERPHLGFHLENDSTIRKACLFLSMNNFEHVKKSKSKNIYLLFI